jgi:antitoxin component of RelBE/YafQ-DinJ toxin-antitoxin module
MMMKEVTIRLDDDTFVKLWAMARRYGITFEEAARRCVKYVVNEVEDPNADPINDPTVRKLLSWILPVTKGGEGE